MTGLTATEQAMLAYALAFAPLERTPNCPECGAPAQDAGTVDGEQRWECADEPRAHGTFGATEGVFARCDEGAFQALAERLAAPAPTPGLWLATMESEHYSWHALGDSEEAAFAALGRAWTAHIAGMSARDFDGPPMTAERALEHYGANVSEIAVGQGYRDGEPVS